MASSTNWAGYFRPPMPRRSGPGPIDTVVPGRNPISLQSYYPSFTDYYPLCELQTKRWFFENIEADWVCLDVGANIGYHSILMAECAVSGFVYSFEPTSTSKMFLKNLEVAGVKNFELVEEAVGSQSGVFREKIYRIWGKKPERLRQAFTTIDDFVEGRNLARVDLIKIDVDGFGYEALLGAERTLERYGPTVVVELNHALQTRGYTPSDAFAFMLSLKYSEVLILDKDNYVFSRKWSLGSPYPQSLRVRQDRRDPLENSEVIPSGDPLADMSSEGQLRNGATHIREEVIAIAGPVWDYALTFPLPPGTDLNTCVVIEIHVSDGEVGVFLTDSGGSKVMGFERVVGTSEGRQVLVVPVEDKSAVMLVLRKTTGVDTSFSVFSCNLHRSIQTETSAPKPVQDWTVDELSALTASTPGPTWGDKPLQMVTTCSVADFAKISDLGPNLPELEDLWPLGERLMEREDAALLAFLYRQINPARHFEFGTWEGFGSTLCLKNSDAIVWTVNLPLGESKLGNPVYTQSREPYHRDNPGSDFSGSPSDSGSGIGWMYRSSHQENRVHQLLVDSISLDVIGLEDSFDSVMIDGSHEREVVARDIEKALALVKPSGWIILHDFSMEPRVVRSNSSTRGVLAAVADHIRAISKTFDALWVSGSLLLFLRPKAGLGGPGSDS